MAAVPVYDNKSRFYKTVHLHDWWLIWNEDENNHKRLAIAGYTSRGCFQQALRVFSSSPILRRHDVYTLVTTDSTYVRIIGRINKTRTQENGFSSEVFKNFDFGFPPHWEACAIHYLAVGFASNDVSREDASLKDSSQTIEECNTTNVGAYVSHVSTDPKLDKDPGWKKTADIEIESNSKEIADIKEANKSEKKTQNNVSSENASLKGCCNANAKNIHEMTNASANVRLVNMDLELDQDHAAHDASLKGCGIACKQTNESNTNANVSLSSTNPEVDQDPTGCMILEGSENSNEAVRSITRSCGAKDTDQRRTTDHEMEINIKENAVIKEASIAEEKTCNNISTEYASLEGCSTASEQINEMTSTETNVSIANSERELDQAHTACMSPEGSKNSNEAVRYITRARCAKDTDQRKTVAVEKDSIMEENTARKEASTTGKKTCSDASRRFKESSKKSNKAVTCRTRTGGAENTDRKRIATVKKENTLITKGASKETSTTEMNTKRKLIYEIPVSPKADVTTSFSSPGLSSVKRSRSGRLLLPSLEYWRRQTALYDPDHQVIGIKDEINTPSRAELPHKPERSEERARSKNDPNAASNMTHEPKRARGRPRSTKTPAAAKSSRRR